MKKKNVCKGCKYHIEKCQLNIFIGSCDYATMTGKSRLLIERANGGYQKDRCICREEGERERERIPWKINKE